MKFLIGFVISEQVLKINVILYRTFLLEQSVQNKKRNIIK